MNRDKIWIVASAIVMIGVLALGWFVGVQPQLAAKASTDAQRATVDAQNESTTSVIAKLKGDFATIDEWRERLEELRASIPADAQLPLFVKQLDDLASSSATVITGIAIADAIPYTPPATTETGAAAEGDEEADGSDSGDSETEDATEPAPTEPAAPDIFTDARITGSNFVAIPIGIQLIGTYADALDFVSELQHGTRLFLVTTLTTEENSDDPALVDATIAGYAYALIDE